MGAVIFMYFYVCFMDRGARTSTNSLTLSHTKHEVEHILTPGPDAALMDY